MNGSSTRILFVVGTEKCADLTYIAELGTGKGNGAVVFFLLISRIDVCEFRVFTYNYNCE